MNKRGFAAMDPEKRREAAAKGGMAGKGRGGTFRDPEVARAAGRIGGKNVRKEDRMFYKDRSLAARAGRIGGVKKADKP
jgi:uncharacterized protein